MLRALTLLLILVASNSCRDPRAEANIAEAMMNVGTSINQIQQDLGELHNRIDSLREVAAYQDTVIRQLANLAGLPVRSR